MNGKLCSNLELISIESVEPKLVLPGVLGDELAAVIGER